MEIELHDRCTFFVQQSLKVVDLLVAGFPDFLWSELVDSLDQYRFVVTAIEYDNLTLFRYLCVYAPQEITIEFFRRRDPKTCYSHTLWIDSLKNASNRAIFAARVKSLEND